ncbi:beta-D-xylosidase 6 [Pyrus ussuriensis x Pyrus communis]|uniref:Beta-D-xylosidase 6 n=1 Tax=Pyrus ussuriensis x Pyrus communis TaxID=2448454 RepID=A0A5N5F495_9ROSA|nr:beta-D-xylosidase 6 [Pyrus ussuriensis x Pyrus communis]
MPHHWKSLFLLLLLQLLNLCSTKSQPFTSSSNPHLQFPCKPPHHSSYPFCNNSLPIPTRAQSLISLLTLQEKIQQLSNSASAIPRLGIPPYEWWSESLHGIATNGPGVSFNGTIPSATSFPQVIVTAAAFNRTLWSSIGAAIAVEARAMYNFGQAGLTFWAPNINIFRDPRWGRGQETPGEDPMVASAYAVEFVKGFQGGGIRDGGLGARTVLESDESGDSLMLSACCKHFTAYDLESWRNFSRYSFNAVVSEQDLEDTFQPPFRSCIQQGKASCLMCSYNAVNGVPACAQKDLLDKARNEWGFKGYITSDCDAVATVFEYQNYTKSPEDAVADVLRAGTDIDCGTYLLRNTLSTIKQGKVQEEDIDKALLNLFSVQLRLGLFNGDPRKGKFGSFGAQDVCTSEHKTLALEAARQGIVLLKNDKKFLPLKRGVDFSLAVIGPLANNASLLGGDYTGIPCNPKSPFEGLREYSTRTSYVAGCQDVPCMSDAGFKKAIYAAKKADFVVIVVGIDASQEREDHDRVSLLLPGKQMALVSSVAAASKGPVILVLAGGGPLDVTFAKEDMRIPSILWIGYPGEAGGRALAEVIFGDFNPGGRLPMTWYPESFTNVPMNNMNMRADPSLGYPGRTYRFYTGDRLYGFGHGLSYSSFTYNIVSAPKKLRLSKPFKVDLSKNVLHQPGDVLDHLHIDEVTSCDSLRFFVEIAVKNNGDMDGGHSVMLFSRVPKVVKGAPLQQLIGFNRVYTVSNQYTTASILVDPCTHLTFADEHGERILPLGEHVLMVGDIQHFVSVEIN